MRSLKRSLVNEKTSTTNSNISLFFLLLISKLIGGNYGKNRLSKTYQ